MTKTLINLKIERRYGLSNRIRAMAGHYALSRLKGWDICYEWLPDESCPGTFEDLFKNSLVPKLVDVTVSDYDETIDIFAGSKPTHCGSSEDAIYAEYFVGDDDKDSYNMEVRKFYDSLIPVDEITSKIEQLWDKESALPQNTLGLHIRRTDMVEHLKNIGEPPLSDEKTITTINEYIGNNKHISNIFLSCDNADSEKLYRSVFGSMVFCYDKNWKNENLGKADSVSYQSRLSSLHDALIDILMLSQCHFIIGTRHSSFSTFAAKIGNTKYTRV
tara:strand:- start:1440 stop:2261 length:822 start_codon:yes stop_codon:yes gene_type:complete